MTSPVARTWVDNDALNTSNLNTGVRDPIAFLLDPPRAQLRQTTFQTVNNNTATPITFTTEDYDNYGGHDNAVNTSRYTCQVAGWYRLSGKISWSGSSAGRRANWWRKNGTDINGSQLSSDVDSATGVEFPAATIDVLLAVGDYVELVGYQDIGAGLNTVVAFGAQHSYMLVRWVGES